ncbi:MAG: CHASE2 domain-containing protein [Cyanobacteria bacterium J06627_28]
MLGRTLNKRYKLTRILGAGGFGQTYLAIDIQQSHRPQCVVKQLKPASQEQNFLTVARRLFDTEAKTLQELGHHSQIPNSIGSFEEDSEFYLVQEFIDGQSLEDEIKQAGKFTEAQAIALLQSVLPVLGFIHQHHVVHRDLKPDNLIRRRDSEDVVLIDFGAVKEIRTKVITGERTGLTIGIGTQGYTPSEQLSGKPRYSSDIYALGMTLIHALTGRAPTELPENMGSLEPQWERYAAVSPGFSILLGKMTRHYIHQRYKDVDEVLHDLNRLDELPVEAAKADTYIETSMPMGLLGSEAQTALIRWQMSPRAKRLTVAIATVVTSVFVLGLRQVGAFVPAELAVWDRLLSAQPDPGPDPRLLIVGISEADMRQSGGFTLSDADLATAIDNLQAHQPARIGIDLLRDQPVGEGADDLAASLKDPNVAVITRLSDPDSDNLILPPSGVMFEQLTFSNLVIDPDFRVRRSLMVDYLDEAMAEPLQRRLAQHVNESSSERKSSVSELLERPVFSMGTELAIRYLEQYENISPEAGDILQLGDIRFEPLTQSFGGYQSADDAGYQLFLRYRSPEAVAARLSFSDVLNNNFDPAQVKNKIIFIGSTARNSRDVFLTPYNTGENFQQMHGVEVHAQIASQILSAVLDGEKLPWAWPDWAEVVWIVALTGIGSGLMVVSRRGPLLIFFGVSGLTLTVVVGVVCFQLGGWVPVFAPMNAFFWAAAGARISKSYQRRHWEDKIDRDSQLLAEA